MLANVIIRAGLMLALVLGGSYIALHVMNQAEAAITSPIVQALQ